jgi:DNA mismatch endonuclease (patch repair protein)
MDRTANMRAIRNKDTGPEIQVRSLVHRLGYRFRLHRKDLPGKPDLVFASRRKVIFVHGCFWHCHSCKRATVPKSNREFWANKLKLNKIRDRKTLMALAADGWDSLVVWQCELKDINRVASRVSAFLNAS